MKLNQNLNRRQFIAYFFSAFILAFLIKDNLQKKPLNIDEGLHEKIKKFNSTRKISSQADYKLAIQNDHEQNRTIWIGKKLYTYAELIN